MATQTPYFGLTKSGGTEAALIGVYNNNMDIIDLEIWQSMVRAAINLAPIYDETAAYVEGSYCTLLETVQQTVTGFHLYKCTTDTTDPAGTFDPSSWSEVDITSEMGHGGGGGGGHTYIGNDGSTAMTQRDNAQFVGAYMEDDSSNDITKVNVMRSMHHADFEQLSDAEKKGIIFVDDETGAVEDKFQPVIYSLEEREIGVWTNGKPLYEKTIEITAPSSDETTINHDISDADYIYIKEGTLTKTGNGTTPYETYHSSSIWGCGVYNVNRTNFTLFVGSSLRQYVNGGFITFRYTKTTDQAGSGQWTPQGVPTVHYSTTEQLVGTYHGEPLYQKDLIIPLENVTTMQTFTPSDTGIGTGSRIQVVIDAAFENSGGQRLRQSTWYGNNYWTYMTTSQGNILVKKETTDPNWTTGVHFIATVQYTKASS